MADSPSPPLTLLATGVLVFIFGPLTVIVLERVMGRAPTWIWRTAAFLCLMAGWSIVLLNEPIKTQVNLHPRGYALASGMVILVAAMFVNSRVFDLDGTKKEATLEVDFKDEPPYTEDSGPSGLGLYYSNRRIGIRTSVAGVTTVKVPIIKLENGQIRSNVFLQPAEHQPEQLDAGDPGYWRVVQWNTSEVSIKLVHKGKESYYLGPCTQFEIAIKCGELTARKWVTTRIADKRLLFELDDEKYPEKLGADIRLHFLAVYEDWNMPVEGGATAFDHLIFIRLHMVSKLAETNIDSLSAVLNVDGTDYIGEQHNLEDHYLQTLHMHRIGVEPAVVRPVHNELPTVDRYLKPGIVNDGWICFRFNSVEWPDKGRKNEADIKKHLTLSIVDGFNHKYTISVAQPWPWDNGKIKRKASPKT